MKSNRIASIIIKLNREIGESFQAYLWDSGVHINRARGYTINYDTLFTIFQKIRNPLPNILVYAVVLEFTEKTIMRDCVKCL